MTTALLDRLTGHFRNHGNCQRELELQTPSLSATPACPGGPKRVPSHARRSAAPEGTARRADPPVRFRDKPVKAGGGPFSVRSGLLTACRLTLIVILTIAKD